MSTSGQLAETFAGNSADIGSGIGGCSNASIARFKASLVDNESVRSFESVRDGTGGARSGVLERGSEKAPPSLPILETPIGRFPSAMEDGIPGDEGFRRVRE